ncbi:P-loop containing nucleoside triphosphate hydrolase protein [Tuber indicum]|nr:P-loop containing nucleoside triphosphate hydrolase protein [Tuber indicum]
MAHKNLPSQRTTAFRIPRNTAYNGQPIPTVEGFLQARTALRGRGGKPVEKKADKAPVKDYREIYTLTEQVLRRLSPPLCHSPDTNCWYKENPMPPEELRTRYLAFVDEVLAGFTVQDYTATGSSLPTPEKIATIHKKGRGLDNYFVDSFLQYIGQKDLAKTDIRMINIKKAADMRFPQEWYPMARQFKRTWHLHVGPTNSGKTYNALKRLEEAADGIYAGPLRLLAHEIFERMNSKGIPCNLVTGDDMRIVSETAAISSSTVEMVDLNREVEVAVLDEIQMIGDEDRGWAWTQALLGVRAKEVHMCGEERTVDLIKSLAANVGDECIVHNYKRLGPLEVMKESLGGDLTKIQKGDCVVTFSRKSIFAMKKEIERVTGLRCAVIYGSLPPETRSLQARYFNDPESGYDVLVASDAVGMGLNLSIKRMIFETTIKWNGSEYEPISVPHIKQIAGRAGRYKVAVSRHNIQADETIAPLPAAPSVGLVTTLDEVDYQSLKYAMSVTPKPIATAGILPNSSQVEEFASLYPPDKELSFTLKTMDEAMHTRKLFHICRVETQIKTAKLLEGITGLRILEKLQFCMAPIGRNVTVQEAVRKMAECVGYNKDGSLLEIPNLDLEVLDIDNPKTMPVLQRLESLHKTILVWLWLSWRFPATFAPRETAQGLKMICEEKIDIALSNVRFERGKKPRYERITLGASMDAEEIGRNTDVEGPLTDLGDEDGETVLLHLNNNLVDSGRLRRVASAN